METTHHDINNDVILEINEKRIDKLQRKQVPKTAIERQKGFYWFLFVTAIVCEAIDCVFTMAGFIQFAQDKLNDNGYILALIIGGLVLVLSYSKHRTNETFHSQRLDDEHVTKITYVFLLAFYLIGGAATYNVVPAALKYFTKPSELFSIAEIESRFDTLIAQDLAIIEKEIALADTSAASFYNARSYKDKLRSDESEDYALALKAKTDAQAKATAIVLVRNNERIKAVKEIEKKNDALIKEHLDWCTNSGFWLALFFFMIELLHFPAKWFCENFERQEVLEAKKKKQRILDKEAKEIELIKSTYDSKVKDTPKVEETPKDKEGHKAKDIEKQEVRPITLGKQEPKEGDIEKGEGKKRDRVLVEVAGNLRPMTFGQINTLIAGQSTSERIQHLENLKNKLK
jgi:uncharacterized membrane protein YiaA